ncbi:uncharacterized protein [Oscarella lobularis]|uniref:uncharacterized protein isoform X2 n=1 Tax=Oscarella lobularis TaxID=121494 RepID=UPI0033140829
MDMRSTPSPSSTTIESQLDETTQENLRLRRTLAQFRSTTEQLTKRYEKLLADSQHDRQRVETLEQNLTASTKANDDLTMRLSDLMTERDAAVRRAREIEERRMSSTKDDDERRPSLSLLSELQMLRRAVDSYQRELETTREDVERLQQECSVSKKERQDALEEQESLTGQCYRLKTELDAATSSRDELATKSAELETTVVRLELELDRARRESREAQEKRNWAFEARSQVVRECNEARLACDDLRQARDQAVSNHMEALHELDGLKTDLAVALRESKEAKNERRIASRKTSALIERLTDWLALQDEAGGQHTGFDSGVGSSEQKDDVGSGVKVKISSVDLTIATESDADSSLEKQRKKISLTGAPSEWGITWETRLFAAEVRAGNAVDLVEPGSCVTEINGFQTSNCSLDKIRESIDSLCQGGGGGTLTVQKTPLKIPADVLTSIKECKAALSESDTTQPFSLRLASSWASLVSGGGCRNDRDKSPATSVLGDLASKNDAVAKEEVTRKQSVGSSSLTVSWAAASRRRSLSPLIVKKEKESKGAVRQSLSPPPPATTSADDSRKRRSISTELRDEIRKSLNEARLISANALLSPDVVASPLVRVTRSPFSFENQSTTTPTATGDARHMSWSVPEGDSASDAHSPSPPALFVAGSKRSSIAAASPLAAILPEAVAATTPPSNESRNANGFQRERTVTLQKRNGTLGFLIKGGNATGIFVSEIRPGFTLGGLNGVQPGDEILMVGEHSLIGLTRQEAADILRGVVDSVALVVRHNMLKFLQLPSSCDSFYVKCVRSYEGNRATGEISLSKGDTLRITDTVVNHPASSWHAVVVSGSSSRSGTVPNIERSLQDGKPLYERIDRPTLI